MNYRHITLVFLTLSLSSSPASPKADTKTDRLVGPYLGQHVPGDEAVLFAPGVVSIDGRYEYALSFAPDGNEVLFSAEVQDEPSVLYLMRFEAGQWTPPRKVSLSEGKKKSEMEAFFTPDGKRIYFAPYDEGMDVRIWVVDRSKDGWLEPRQLGEPLSGHPAFFPTTTTDGTIYYTNLTERKVYRAEMEGDNVLQVEDAGLELGMHAFIAPDESFVLVDGRPEGKDKADIFVAFRNEDGSWMTPANLGPEVNTDHSETCPSLSHDGKYLFFSRYNEEGERSNIYWIDSAVISDAR
jgi:Tol biopolymer transport system component